MLCSISFPKLRLPKFVLQRLLSDNSVWRFPVLGYIAYYNISLNDTCFMIVSVHALTAFIIDGLRMYILSPVRDYAFGRWL